MRESNSLRSACGVADDNISWRGIGVFTALFAIVVTLCVISGLSNMANAALQDVTFKAVTFNSGATLHLNGDKSLTAIDGGTRLIANDLSGEGRGLYQQGVLDDYAASNYGDDALASGNTISNPKSLSEAELNTNRIYMPTVSGDYWLSNLYTRSQLKWASYSTSSNRLAYNTLYATGRDGDYWYDNTPIARGSYKWADDFWLSNYTSPYGWSWAVSGTGQKGGCIYLTESSYFGNGTKVYNNPQCLETGTDEYGNPNRATYVQNLVSGSDRKFFGSVSSDGKRLTYATAIGSRIPAGTVLYFGFLKSKNELRDPTGFASSTGSYYVGFIKTTSSNLVKSWFSFSRYPLPGFIKLYDSNQRVTAPAVLAPRLPVRPAYDADYSSIAFTRPATSGETLSGIGTFGDAPKSVNNNGDDVKAVVKSESVTIANNLSTNRVTSDRPNVTYADDKIRVPYGAKTLSFDPKAFTTSNASYISALASTDNLQNYAVWVTAGGTLRINLENILNTSQVGSTATVSFYAEKTNAANTTDLISKTPVTVQLEVVDGTEQTITYSLDGGAGTAPTSDKVKSGRTYTMADGAGLSRDGNPFSSWQLTYLPYGEANSVTRFVGANESIVVPETSDGKITATAVYAGVMAKKTTEASSSVVTVTWDVNSPENANAKFADAATGEYNTARTKKYDKIKVAGTSVIVPTESDLEIDVTKIFDGWWTSKDETGTKLSETDVQISPTANVTYYAHWMDGYRVTYDATGGAGASQTGKFSDNTTEDSEIVLPGASTKGPSKGTPVADNSLYMFNGWFSQPNGGGTELKTGTSFATLGGSKTVYAYYISADTFLAPATSKVTANPRNISGTKYSIQEVKAAATDIASRGTSSSYYQQYTTWMNADSYHLYTLLNGKDPDQANSWLECRIIHVGQHDSDGTGITFQAIHALPNKVAYDSTYSGSGNYTNNWSSSTLRSYLKNTFKATLPSSLSSSLATATKKSNALAGQYPVKNYSAVTTQDQLWILSFTELVKNAGTKSSSYWGAGSDAHDGSTYSFWSSKDLVTGSTPSADSEQVRLLTALNSDRAGNLIFYDTLDYGYSWQRSVSPYYSSVVLCFYSIGDVGSGDGGNPFSKRCVAPSFAL